MVNPNRSIRNLPNQVNTMEQYKLAQEYFSVLNSNKETIIFEQYLDEKDDAHIVDCETNETVFKFTSECRMLNVRGTRLGKLRTDAADLWTFSTYVNNEYEHALTLKSMYPYEGEREVIKWLIETNQYEIFRTK